jgi:transcriptional regulator with GAF, ATPase, and Fis domain
MKCSCLGHLSFWTSELFGHMRGSFTGAFKDKPGRLEAADRGTVFLDEIADLTPALQTKFLRFVHEQSFERIGGDRTIQVDARIIAASNRDLTAEVAARRFREDLFYRLNVITLPRSVSRVGPGYLPGFSRLSFHGRVFSELRASFSPVKLRV